MSFKGMIFDFNGVLFWDSDIQTRAWKEFSRRLRETELSDDEILVEVHGRNMRHSFEYLLGRPVDAEDLAAFTDGKEDIYRKLCLDSGERFRLSPGAEEFLDELKARGIPRAIATAMEISNIEFFIKHFNLLKWFERSRIVYDDGSHPGKPAPDIYVKAAWRLGLEPKDCVVVEDSVSGLAAAVAAKAGFVAALGPKESHERLARIPGVTQVVESIGQLAELKLFA
jgi:HAD superfamily hydrolase (TIGR01509 family)